MIIYIPKMCRGFYNTLSWKQVVSASSSQAAGTTWGSENKEPKRQNLGE